MGWKGFGSSTPSSLSRRQLPGAPYLARFSRDVGYRRASPLALPTQATVQGKTRGIPHLAKNERDMGHPAFGVTTGKGAPQIPPLRYRGFPVEVSGIGELHAAFRNESRTRGRW